MRPAHQRGDTEGAEQGRGSVVCTYAGSTAVGAGHTVIVVATAASVGNATVTANTTSSTSDPTPANAQASASIALGLGAIAAPSVVPALDPALLAWLGLLLGLVGVAALRRSS